MSGGGLACRICGEIGHGGCAPTLKEMAVIDAARALVPWPGDDWSHRIQAVLDAVRALDGETGS